MTVPSVLSGRELAADIRAGTAAAAAELTAAHRPPRLTVVTATDDEASAWYVRSIASAAAKAGIGCEVETLGPQATAAGIGAQLTALSADPTVHGIILTTPLPGAPSRSRSGPTRRPSWAECRNRLSWFTVYRVRRPVLVRVR